MAKHKKCKTHAQVLDELDGLSGWVTCTRLICDYWRVRALLAEARAVGQRTSTSKLANLETAFKWAADDLRYLGIEVPK